VDVGLVSDVGMATHFKLDASDVRLDHAHDIKTAQGNTDSCDVPADDTASLVGDIAARGAETNRRDGVGTGCCVAADKATGRQFVSARQEVSPGDDQGRDGGGPSSTQEGKQVWT